MRHNHHQGATASRTVLGIEGGGTRTVALWESETGERSRVEFGPGNLALLKEGALRRLLRQVARALPRPQAVAIGLAGAKTEADQERIRRAAATVWPRVPCHATNDLETALAAAQHNPSKDRPGHGTDFGGAQVLVLSGTGSCCYGKGADGRTVKIGGWGHMLGDKGSAYEIGLRSLKAVVYYYDRDGVWPGLGQRLLRCLQLNEPNQLIPWVQQAAKTDVARLALEVFAAWQAKDRIADDILTGARHSLAKDAMHCARCLAGDDGQVHFVLTGGVLTGQPRFARSLTRELRRRRPGCRVTVLAREGAEGALRLAKGMLERVSLPGPESSGVSVKDNADGEEVGQLARALTEQRNPRSMRLSRMPMREAIALMLREESRVTRALSAEQESIERGLRLIVRALRNGGRLFYVGAGTSGRLGVLDASECPPTFQSSPEQVQGILAGGQWALWQSIEGAEDDPQAGARSVAFRGVDRNDVVVGIAASGRTPFVWGALSEAKARGAATILLTFNPRIEIPRTQRPRVVIAPEVGPEVLTGSTRLKAGTATKLVLNMFTTLAMVRLGKVESNLMVDVKPSNAKLKDRAVRIVQALTGYDYEASRKALERKAWRIRPACRDLGGD